MLEELKLERYRRYADRIRVILLLDEGKTVSNIASYLFLDEGSVRNYRKSYEEGGLDQLVLDGYKGGISKLSSADQIKLSQALESKLFRTTHEIVLYVDHQFGVHYTVSGMTNLLHRLGFSYKKPKGVPGKANREAQKKFLRQYRGVKSHGPVYFSDATHPMFNAVLGYGWIKRGQDFEVKTTAGRQRLNINGAIEINNLDVIARSCESVNKDSTCDLLHAIRRKNPEKAKVYLVMDNAAYNRAKKVRALAKKLKIRLLYLPPYSPNLNPIERLWKFMKKKAISNREFQNFQHFKRDVMMFFRGIRKYKHELSSLITDNFQILGS